MKVNVKIDSNMRKTNALEPPLEIMLGEGKNTLEGVLEKLSFMYADLVLIENGKTSHNLGQLFLNGESYLTFPEGLKRNVNEGDTVLVDIYIDLVSGG
jgi:hypothetical protein